MTRWNQRIVRSGIAAILTASGLTLAAPATPAAAAVERNGRCEVGEFCFYFLERSNRDSAISDHSSSLNNYGAYQPDCWEFKGSRDKRGVGACIKNNAIGYWNRTNGRVAVYVRSYYNDADGYSILPAGASGDLNYRLRNNNASHCLTLGLCGPDV